MDDTTYPNILTFKDSRVTWIVLSILLGVLLIYIFFNVSVGGKEDQNGFLTLVGFYLVVILFTLMPPTVSELSPEGVKIKAAFSKPIFRKWEDINDFRIYRGHRRRFVTFQDPSKRLQKHVFLVPINFWSKPKEVLATVKAYQEAALKNP